MSFKNSLNAGVSRLVLAGVVSGLLLTACKPNSQSAGASSAPPPLAALPLATTAAPAIVPAPTADALPPAPPANVGSLANGRDRYAFADRAYAMSSAFGDAPPDYTFDYGDGERPWVWRGDDQSTRVAEPLPGGGYRYYYYEPGADTPYLVRDPDDSYGYDNGVLVVIYDRQGRALPPTDMRRRADTAGRFLARAQAIYQASQRQQREAVAQANWAARRTEIDAERSQWAADQAADPDWRAYHEANAPQEDSHWDAERYRRESEAARFAQSINDQQLAQRDWQAAQKAQARAAQPPKESTNSGSGFGPKPQPQPGPQTQPGPQMVVAPPASPASGPPHDHRSPPPQAGGPAVTAATPSSGPVHDHRPPSPLAGGPGQQGPRNGSPSPGQPAVVHAEPGHLNPSHAPTDTALQAQKQAEATRQAQTQAAITHQNQIDAQHRAQLDAQSRAQAEAAHQAQTQATASHLAQIEANHRAEIQAQTQAHAAQQAKRDIHQPPPAVVVAPPVHHADAPKPPTGAPPPPPHDNHAHDPHHGAPKDHQPGDKP